MAISTLPLVLLNTHCMIRRRPMRARAITTKSRTVPFGGISVMSWDGIKNPGKCHRAQRLPKMRPQPKDYVPIYPPATGVKTGTTAQGGFNLVASAESDDKSFIGVVLGAEDPDQRFRTAQAILEYGFERYEREALVRRGEAYGELSPPYRGGESVELVAVEDVTGLVISGSEPERQVTSEKPPQKAEVGEELGEVEVFVDGQSVGRSPLVAREGYAEATLWAKARYVVGCRRKGRGLGFGGNHCSVAPRRTAVAAPGSASVGGRGARQRRKGASPPQTRSLVGALAFSFSAPRSRVHPKARAAAQNRRGSKMNLRFIPTRVHGVLDYVNGTALLAAPELLRTKDEPRAALVSRLAGGGATVSTLMTDFELGAVKAIPVPVHLTLDAVSGALLAGAPWLLGYAKGGTRYWLPHAFVGTAEVLAAAATKTEPSYYKAKPESVDVVRDLLKAKRGSGWRRTESSGGTYGGTVGLVVGTLSAGMLILFLLRRTRGGAREKVEEAPEAARSGVEEYARASRTEAEPPQEAVEHPADQEEDAVKAQEGDAVEEPAEERKRTVREFARRLEEHSASREQKDASEKTGGEPGGAVQGSARSSEEPASRDREGGRSEEPAGEEARRTGARDSACEQITVVGVLAKMGEAFEETGGGRFILSSEDEGNFDLRGKEDELDEVHQQQIEARVVGRIIDADSQPRKMEVDKVEPA